MSESPLRAIPTTFTRRDGQTVHLKSRLEAFVAWLLDKLELEWQYEPESFMLPNGVNYLPDFWLPAARVWVETRGYDTAKGRKQLEGFAQLLCAARHGESYLVLEPERVSWQGPTGVLLQEVNWATRLWLHLRGEHLADEPAAQPHTPRSHTLSPEEVEAFAWIKDELETWRCLPRHMVLEYGRRAGHEIFTLESAAATMNIGRVDDAGEEMWLVPEEGWNG